MPLSSTSAALEKFDIRDGFHYIFTPVQELQPEGEFFWLQRHLLSAECTTFDPAYMERRQSSIF